MVDDFIFRDRLFFIKKSFILKMNGMITFQKFEVFFSQNVKDQLKNGVVNVVDVSTTFDIKKYLGLPSTIGRNKKPVFNFIKDKVWQKITSWKSKALSRVGRENLINSVFQSISTYVMNIFLIPQSLEDDIQKMMNSFQSGSNKGNNHSIYWLSMNKLSISKEYGGMRFKNLYAFNLSMLVNQT